MLRLCVILMLSATAAASAPRIGEEVGKLGMSGAKQTPAFLLNDEYRSDYAHAQKCALKSHDGDVVSIGQKAVYADDPKQGIVVLLDEYARRFAIDYCWK